MKRIQKSVVKNQEEFLFWLLDSNLWLLLYPVSFGYLRVRLDEG